MAMHKNLLKRLNLDDKFGTEVTIPVPRQHFLHRLSFKAILGALSGGAGGNYVAGAANLLVTNIQVKIGGSLTKDNISMADLRRLNVLAYKDKTPTDGFAYLDLGRLPTHAFTSLDLIVTISALAPLQDGDRTATLGTVLEVRRLEELNVGQEVRTSLLQLRKTIRVSADSQTEVKQDIRSGNVLQQVLVIPSSDTLINSLSIVQDGVKYHLAGEPWDDLKEETRLDFELDANPDGWAVLNLDRFGDGSQALRTAGMNTLEIIFDINAEAGGFVRLVPVEVATPQ